MTDLTILGNDVRHSIQATDLETFPTPEGVVAIEFATDELLAVCPLTAQPDHYQLTVRYSPDRVCLETKSLKLYLWSFRDRGIFAEALACQVATDLSAALGVQVDAELTQSARGGIVTRVHGRAS